MSSEEAERPSPRQSGNIHAILLCAAITSACLFSFLNKAFHIDDPLSIWVAQQIQIHPLDFFGFDVNWSGQILPMYKANFNPPLNSYILAALAAVFGWREIPLHFAYLVFPVAATIATYCVARRFCSHPAVAALAFLFTPLMLVSSTNLMTDIVMLALYLSAIELWLHGFERKSHGWMAAAMLLVAAGELAKYFALTAVPLLFLYALVKERRVGWWALSFAIPIGVIAAFEAYTMSRYGVGSLSGAAETSLSLQTAITSGAAWGTLIGLSFLGGGTAFVGFAWLLRLTWKAWSMLLLMTLAIGVLAFLRGSAAPFEGIPSSMRIAVAVQFGVFVVAGIGILMLAADDLWKTRSAESVFFAAWILGTLAFSIYLNWSITGRTVLPAVPAAAILLVRRAERESDRAKKRPSALAWGLALIPAIFLSLLVTWADCAWANSAREASRKFAQQYAGAHNPVFFEGHWGFQYYMQRLGAQPVDLGHQYVAPGVVVIIPQNNSGAAPFPEQYVGSSTTMEIPSSWGIATMESSLGAGFYTSAWGPLPYAFGPVRSERYVASVLKTP